MLELAYPWLMILAPLPLVVRWVLPAYRERRESIRAPFFAELAEQSGLRPEPGAIVPRRNLLQKLLWPLAWMLLIAAVVRPQWVEDPITRIESGRDLMLAVDLSGSMETRDFAGPEGEPLDRLAAVKLVLQQFVEKRETDRLGLVLFGNAAFVQVPFTQDHEIYLQLLDEAQIGMAGPQTMIGDAIGLAIRSFDSSEAEQRVLILLTDGNDTGSKIPPPKAAGIAAQHNVTIHSVGVGDPKTAGEAPLDEAALREIAETTGGVYFRANDLDELTEVYARLDELEPLDFETQTYRPKRELYPWAIGGFVLLGLLYHLAMAARSLVGSPR